jgi:hypothetical protein
VYKNRRQKKITDLRRDFRRRTKRYRTADEEDRLALAEMRNTIRCAEDLEKGRKK